MKEFQKAARSRCRIKMALQGPSGSGKTYSALLVAFGLTGDWSKVAVIDSENGSSNLYSDLGEYSVLSLTAPYSPEQYSEAINLAVKSGFECVIVDSLSAEWSGQGGVLDIHSNIPGNSFTAWGKVTPRHNAFVQTILQSDIHVIGTMRSKTDYVLAEKNGKQVPEKVGLKATQREDVEYEFTVVLELNQRHIATVSKDRTGLFRNKPEVKLSAEIGQEIAAWCNDGVIPAKEIPVEEVQDTIEDRIMECKTVEDLIILYNENPKLQAKYQDKFIKRKDQINLTTKNIHLNGVHH